MKRYVKKPVIIEAIQFKKGMTIDEISKFVTCECNFQSDNEKLYGMSIVTLEGEMEVAQNDFIIRGIKGEFYPCKPDIFVASYEEVLE